MSEIFTNGEVVDTIHIPTAVMRDGWQKQTWGVSELRAYIQRKHGPEFASQVVRSKSQDYKVTGTSATYQVGGKSITYMLVEKKDSPTGEVHIVRSKGGASMEDQLAFIDYQFSTQGQNEQRGFKNNPFAALAKLKA